MPWPFSKRPKKPSPQKIAAVVNAVVAKADDFARRSIPAGYTMTAYTSRGGDIVVRFYFPNNEGSYVLVDPDIFDEWLLCCQQMRAESRGNIGRIAKRGGFT